MRTLEHTAGKLCGWAAAYGARLHRLNPYAAATIMVALALAAAECLPAATAVAAAALVLLVPVWASALVYGLRPSLAAAVEAAVAYNFFFIPPLYTFAIADGPNVLAFLIFMAVAASGSLLATRLRDARLAAETERLRAALLTTISHDLKTPLASILGTVTSLQTAPFNETARQEMLGEIQEEAERLHRFITNLLDMTRLESAAIHPRREPADLADIVGSALRRAEKLLAAHRLAVEIPGDLPLAELDPVLMEQVLFNLLDNAAKYTPAGSVVTIRAQCDGNRLVLQIADQGAGLPTASREQPPRRSSGRGHEELPRRSSGRGHEELFEKFYRGQFGETHPAGTGLGLAICRGFLAAMGGTITAANREDCPGAVFTITLPALATGNVPDCGEASQ